MQGRVPWDNGISIEDALFAPFAEAAFPKQLDTPQLIALLDAPFTTRIPLPQSSYQSHCQLYPDLFSLEAECSAPFAAVELVTALLTQRPRDDATKTDHISFRGRVGYHLPEVFGRRLALPICVTRGLLDSSLTTLDKVRDYMLHLDNVMLLGGVDMADDNVVHTAVHELMGKHKGIPAALYGDLGYIILIATAGNEVRVFALELGPGDQMLCLISQFSMATYTGRQRILKLFINVTRWMRTVHELRLLPLPPPAQLLVPFYRRLPYPADAAGHHLSEAELVLHFIYVEKKFAVPGPYMQELLHVYALLNHLNLPGTIHCRSLKIDLEAKSLVHPMEQLSPSLCNSDSCYVELELEPVGAQVHIRNLAELHSLVHSILTTLQAVHSHGIVHRDICKKNIVRAKDGWLLIDWELAGKTNQHVWWEGPRLPDSVRQRIETYTVCTDLWQVAKLIEAEFISYVPAVESFTKQLLAGKLPSAAAALAAMWDVASEGRSPVRHGNSL